MSRDRYMRARRAGAGSLNREEWNSTVASAEAIERLKMDGMYDAIDRLPDGPYYTRPRPEPVWLAPDEMVVKARTILEVEAEFALAEAIQHEIAVLAKDDMDSARRARLLNTVDELRQRIARRGDPS